MQLTLDEWTDELARMTPRQRDAVAMAFDAGMNAEGRLQAGQDVTTRQALQEASTEPNIRASDIYPINARRLVSL